MSAYHNNGVNVPTLMSMRTDYMAGNYIGSAGIAQGLDFHKPDAGIMISRYGRDDLSGLLNLVPGFKSEVKSRIEYYHGERDWIHGLVYGTHTAAASNTGTLVLANNSKTSLTYNQSPYQSTNSVTSVVPRLYDLLQLPTLSPLTAPLEVYVIAVNGTTDVTIASIDGSDIPTIVATDEIIVKGNLQIEGSTYGKSRVSRTISYKNTMGIHRDQFEVTGTEQSEQTWYTYENKRTGEKGNVWYLEGTWETYQRFMNEREMMLFDGSQIDSSSAIPNTAGFETVTKTEGLLTTIKTAGIMKGYTAGALTLADVTDVARSLNKNKGDKINLLAHGFEFGNDFNKLWREGEGLGSHTDNNPGRIEFSAGNGITDMAINLNFTRATVTGNYTFLCKMINNFSDPMTLGAVGQGYDETGVVIPMSTTVVYNDLNDSTSSETVPTIRLNYKVEHGGKSRLYKEWVTGSVGAASTSEEDIMRVNMLSQVGLETYAINRFAAFVAV